MGVLPALSAELVMFRRRRLSLLRGLGPRDRADLSEDRDRQEAAAAARSISIAAPDKSVTLKSPIRYTPTFVLVEDGQERARIEGYPGEFFFWPRLENLLP